MAIENFTSEDENEGLVSPDDKIEKITWNQEIQALFLKYSTALYQQKLYYKYQNDDGDIFWGSQNIKTNQTEFEDLVSQNLIPQDLYDKYTENWLTDCVATLYDILLRDYVEKGLYKKESKKYTNAYDLITDEWKQNILSKIEKSFWSLRTKLNRWKIKENSDLFSLFVITNVVLWKKVWYHKIEKSYDSFFASYTQQEIVKGLQNQLELERNNLNGMRTKIEKSNSYLTFQSEEFSNVKSDFYNNLRLAEELNLKVDENKNDVKVLEQKREEKRKELEKYKNDLEMAKKIKAQIDKIDEEIKIKEQTIRQLEEEKTRLEKLSFPWYNLELSEEESDLQFKKQKIQYWLDKYDQTDPEFNAQTVLDAVKNAELAINTLWECTKTSYNTSLKSSYDGALTRLKQKDSDYKVVIPIDYVMAFMFLESHFGMWWLGKKRNPWNVFNDWNRKYSFRSWQDGIEACAYNLWTRILAYQDQFWHDYVPDIKELAENKNKNWIWFIIWAKNRWKLNWYRTWKIIKDWEKIDWTLNPEWAYMDWYPWWVYVLSCYNKIGKINQIYNTSFEIYKKEQQIKAWWLTQDQKTLFQQEIDGLKQNKTSLEQELQTLQESEEKLDAIQTDIWQLWDDYAKELSEMYASQKKVEKTKVLLEKSNKNISEKVSLISENINSMLIDIDNFNLLIQKINIISTEISNFKLKNKNIQETEVNKDLLITIQELKKIQNDSEKTFKDISETFKFIDLKISKNSLSVNDLLAKNQWYEMRSSKEIFYTSYDVDEWYDLSFLNANSRWLWDSIVETWIYAYKQKNYKWFKNVNSYPWKKSEEIKQNYFNLIEPKLSNLDNDEKPDYFVVISWFNDLDTDDTWKNINLIVDDLRLQWVVPVVCSLYPMKENNKRFRDYSKKNQQIKDWYEVRKVIWENIIYVDFWKFLSQQDDEFKEKFYRKDWLHPSEWWAKQMTAFLQENIKKYNKL